jgi:hypothetical protein
MQMHHPGGPIFPSSTNPMMMPNSMHHHQQMSMGSGMHSNFPGGAQFPGTTQMGQHPYGPGGGGMPMGGMMGGGMMHPMGDGGPMGGGQHASAAMQAAYQERFRQQQQQQHSMDGFGGMPHQMG